MQVSFTNNSACKITFSAVVNMAYPTDPIYKFVKDIMTDKVVAVKTQTEILILFH